MLNLASLNQRVNALTAKINNIVPGGVQNLSQVLQQGNSAGASDLDMNHQDILNGNDIQIQTINGVAIAEFQDTLNQVLINGNTATGNDASITLTDTDSITLDKSGLTTSADLTLDVGSNLILNGSLTETSAGGYSGHYLKLTINGVVYKLQLLVE